MISHINLQEKKKIVYLLLEPGDEQKTSETHLSSYLINSSESK